MPVRLPIYAPLGLRGTDADKDSRLYNGFVEKDAEGSLNVYKRPGMAVGVSWALGTDLGRGIFNWQGDIYAIFGGTFYKNVVAVGAVFNGGMYTFSSCLGATPKLFLHNGTNAYTYDGGAGLVAVTDGDYPATAAPGSAYLDGTTYVFTTPASIRGSDFNDPQSWDPLNTIVAQIEPDRAMYLAKQLTYVIAFKQISTEVFYDAGQPVGSPLGPVQGSKIGVGLRHAGTVAHPGDEIAWVGTTTEGDVQVMLLSRLKAEAISTPPVERLLKPLSYEITFSWAAKVAGHRFYVLTLANASLTLAFDLTSKAWYIWTGGIGQVCAATYDSDGTPLLQRYTGGTVHRFLATEYGDEGLPFDWICYTPRIDGGLRVQKANTKVELVADIVDTDIEIGWSDDDYQTFFAGDTVNLNQDRPWAQDGSAFSSRAYRLFNRDLTFLRIKGLDLSTITGII